MYLFSLSAQYNLTSCPLSRPYVDVSMKACVICYGVFSLGERVCTPCPKNQHYNVTTSLCEQNPKECLNGTKLNVTTNVCENITCAEGMKLDLATLICISICKPNEFYNSTTQSCDVPPLECDPGYFYNATSKKCEVVVCPAGQIYDLVNKKCVDKNTISMCPPDRPFWNSTAIKCQVCPTDYPIYNTLYNRCEPCPSQTSWNVLKKKC